MRRVVRPLIVFVAVAIVAVVSAGTTRADAPLVEPMIWQLNTDYPGANQNDSSLPIDTVYIKTHDGTDWMSEFDSNPQAVSGPAAIQNLINVYGSQGIAVAAWFVPKGTDYNTQLLMALQVIDSGVTALYADLEPFQGFCYLDCASLATNFWSQVRQARPNARLGVIYDPRPWWWNQSATSLWFANSDVGLPMCYWETYSGQGIWGDPAGCVTQARADLTVLSQGKPLEYLPVLQGDSTPDKVMYAMDAAVRSSASRVSLWRRGVIDQNVWDMIASYQAPAGPHCAEQLVDGCVIRDIAVGTVYLVQGGARFGFPSWGSLIAMGYTARDIQIMPLGAVAAVPIVPPDGTLLQEFSGSTVYVVTAQARFPISGGGQLPGTPLVIPPGTAGQIPLVPADYTLLQEDGSPDSYLVLHGGRIQMDASSNAALVALGHGGPVFTVPEGGLNQVPVLNVRRGDIDCDGVITSADVTGLLRIAAGLSTAFLCLSVSGDVNCAGGARSDDALLVLLYFAETPASASQPGCPAVGEPAPALLPAG